MNILVFGLGYSAAHYVRHHTPPGTEVVGTVRSADRVEALAAAGLKALCFDGATVDPALPQALTKSDALLVSVQPGQAADPVLQRFGEAIAAADAIRSIVYLSTIGVYGDHGGAWIDETAATEPFNARQGARIAAEADWMALGQRTGKAVTVLRLAGIYGPGRNALDDLRTEEARRIDKPGQVFNRIHVDDIGRAIAAAFRSPRVAPLVNVTDDEPAPAPDVVAYAAGLMGIEPPPLVPFEQASLSAMARSFYSANRRVANQVLKTGLGVSLAYPTYRAGLDALWADGEGRS